MGRGDSGGHPVSARFQIKSEEGDFVVAISSNGGMSFPGYEDRLEYEIAFAAMGGNKSAMMTILYEWLDNPINCILSQDYFLSLQDGALLATDFAEHLLYMFEESKHKDKSVRTLIDKIRYVVQNGPEYCRIVVEDANHIKGLTEDYELFGRFHRFGMEDPAWVSMAMSVKMLAQYVAVMLYSDTMVPKQFRHVTVNSVKLLHDALGQYVSPDVLLKSGGVRKGTKSKKNRVMVDKAGRAEEAWQVRHFVRVMENLQTGKPWPKIGEIS